MSVTTPGSDSVFVDTNILVYCYDADEGEKHLHARRIVADLLRSERVMLSAQILNEFYISLTHVKKRIRLDHASAARLVRRLIAGTTVVPLQVSTTQLALDVVSRQSLSFWDALIWAAAKEHGVPVVYTEDFQHGREIDGVTFTNPFVS